MLPPLQFDSPLYRFVVREEQEPGTVVNGGNAIQITDPALHPNARIRLQFSAGNDLAQHFGLLPNGTLLLRSAIDMESMEDVSRGIVQMQVRQTQGGGGGNMEFFISSNLLANC